MVEGVVEGEGLVLYVFSDSVHLVLGLVDSHLRVGC